nr:MAG: malic enzyme [Candidatus Nanosalinarum sp. J07AB56]
MNNRDEALELHADNPGKISVEPSVEVETADDLELVYTPGVAEPCRRIAEKPEKSYKYTSRSNLVGIVSDGSAVLGLGDIGPEASMPVMEGKANLMKKFADVDGVPLCINADSPQESVEFVERAAPTFGAFNLEDISAPQCFEIERSLKQKLDVPVFHDDQHGTAVVVLAALENALEVVDKSLEGSRITIVGAGASGTAVAEFLHEAGAGEILPVDRNGVIDTGSGGNAQAEARRTDRPTQRGNHGGRL